MGQLYMVNTPRRKSRKRRTAKQQAATRKMIAARKAQLAGKRVTPTRRRRTRKSTGVGTMAKRRRKTTRATHRRRRSTARRRSPVRTYRRRRSYRHNPVTAYAANPRRRGRRHRYRRNPPSARGIFGKVQRGLMDAGATLAGGAVARVAGGFIPLPNTGLTGVAVGVGVAIGVGMVANKVVSQDTARFVVAGAMQVPLKNLITTFVPGAGAYLGDYDNVGAYEIGGSGVGDYLNPGDNTGEVEDLEGVGAYVE